MSRTHSWLVFVCFFVHFLFRRPTHTCCREQHRTKQATGPWEYERHSMLPLTSFSSQGSKASVLVHSAIQSATQLRTTDSLAYKPQIFIPDICRGSGVNTAAVVYWELLLLVLLVVYSLWASPSWVLTWQKGQRASLKGLLKSLSLALDPDDLITPTAPTWPWWPNHLHKHLFYHDDLIPITKNHRPQKKSHTQITCRILEATWKLQSNFGLI